MKTTDKKKHHEQHHVSLVGAFLPSLGWHALPAVLFYAGFALSFWQFSYLTEECDTPCPRTSSTTEEGSSMRNLELL
jgi:hypothetical protein